MKKPSYCAFTLVEIIVATAILITLSTIGFYNYTQNIADARDGVRKTDLLSLQSELNLYKRESGAYPIAWDNFEIRNRGLAVANQGYLNTKVALSSRNTLPMDPKLEIPYIYATTSNRQEFQLAATLENNVNSTALLIGDYKTVSKNVLPNIILAIKWTTPVEINTASGGTTNRNKFIFDTLRHNLPYTFTDGNPYSDGTSFTTLLAEVSSTFWQNSDYMSCLEIDVAGKSITPRNNVTSDEYQILTNSGTLTNTGCTFAP